MRDFASNNNNPWRVAIVGSGPSGVYAAAALLKADCDVRVDMLERLPVPFGLVRYGVAPDHAKLKQGVINVCHQIAQRPGFTFFGNVTVGRDVSVAELREAYDAVIFAFGASEHKRLGIPGETLPGCYNATEFVGWYNGHPDYCDRRFDFSAEVAVVVGQGNVTADIARILGKTADELAHTDICEHALNALAESSVREIHVVGRRGPAQAKFTPEELKELGQLEHCDPFVAPADLQLNATSGEELEGRAGRTHKKNLSVFHDFSTRNGNKEKRCVFHFLQTPMELCGDSQVERILFEKNRLQGPAFEQIAHPTGERQPLACGFMVRSIGYRGVAIDGLPFEASRGVLPNTDGRVLSEAGEPVPGLYSTGWIRRGPTGIIGTNKADAAQTVRAVLADLSSAGGSARAGANQLKTLLAERGVQIVSYQDWMRIDAAEVERGTGKRKPREKFTRVADMLNVAAGARALGDRNTFS